MKIKKLIQSEKADAMRLIWDVFLEFEAPDYVEDTDAEQTKDGIRYIQ